MTMPTNDYRPPEWTADDVWLNARLTEAKGHLDALQAILWRLQCTGLEEHYKAIEEMMTECWKGR
jgi:hypothetical protein